METPSPEEIPPSSLLGALPAGPNGYVFLCRNATQVECLEKKVFGLAQRELERMQTTINDSTLVFLLNMHSGALIGPFAPVGRPGLDLVPEAFEGNFNAQVQVTPVGGEASKAVKINQKMIAGPKTAEEVASILDMLSEGTQIDPFGIDENDKGYASQFPRGKAARAQIGKGKSKGKWDWGWGWGWGGYPKGKGLDALWMLAYGNKGWGGGKGGKSHKGDDPAAGKGQFAGQGQPAGIPSQPLPLLQQGVPPAHV